MRNYPLFNKKIMTPGPVPLPQIVRDSLAQYECHHRTVEFQEVLDRVFENLKIVFQTQQHCYMLASTGSGGLEAAMVNTMRRDKKSLFINAGKFGERWGKIAKALGIPFDEIIVPWGEEIPLDKVRDQLKQQDYQALAFQACETSTGALLPVKELASLCQGTSTLSIVDGITALGAVEMPMDQWGLDVVIGGSQKAFMLPTGMSFLSLSEKAEKAQSDILSYYFDLKAEKKSNLAGQTRFSTPTHFIIALDIVLEVILEKGWDNHLKSIIDRAAYFRNQVQLPLYPKVSSPSLSCLTVPEGVSAVRVQKKVAEEGVIIIAGQDQLKDKVLRIGHMGDMTEADLKLTAELINKNL